MVKAFKAIAAMSLNRVMGREGRIPWHLTEDFRWFKRTTLGHVLVMGRRTFESIGRPLPGRETIVLSRSGFRAAGVRVVPDLDAMDPSADSREYFICGGAEVYAQALPRCSDLYLTVVRMTVEGDVVFPPFEERFELAGVLLERPEFEVQHWRNRDRQG
ncbi:MAG TPA: dihydrofolate reductase [Verrucomicrobiota bacterium]|nr:dihydrofolate reductase [Verrucomicrobiota bacterium]HNU51313.1 dihydrofolate reductase [Verrucomicrobiota bacterium]